MVSRVNGSLTSFALCSRFFSRFVSRSNMPRMAFFSFVCGSARLSLTCGNDTVRYMKT